MNRINKFLCWLRGHKFPRITTLTELFEEHSCSRCGKIEKLNIETPLVPYSVWLEILEGAIYRCN